MLELFAAVTGASLGALATSLSDRARRNIDARDAVIRLTTAVEQISHQLEVLHEDNKTERREIYGRLGDIEQRVSKLEVKP